MPIIKMIEFLDKYKPFVIFFATIVVLLIGNLLWYQRLLPILQLVGLMLLLTFFFRLLNWDFAMIANRNRWLGVFGLCLFGLIIFTLIPFVRWVIYDVFPYFGIILYKKHVSFNMIEFKLRIRSSFSSVVAFTLGYRFYKFRNVQFFSLKNDNRKARNRIETLRYQLALRDVYPHFVESILSTGLGRSLFGGGEQSVDMLIKLNQVLRYVVDQDLAEMKSVPLKLEVDHLRDLIDILQWKYDTSTIAYTAYIDWKDVDQRIIPLALIGIVENAIKYTVFKPGLVLRINLTANEQGLLFECENVFDPIRRQSVQSTQFGLQNLKQRMEREQNGSKLEIEETGNRFLIRYIQ